MRCRTLRALPPRRQRLVDSTRNGPVAHSGGGIMAGTSCVILLLLGTLSSALEGQADGAVLQQAESAFVQGLQLRSQPGAARKMFQEAAQAYAVLLERGRHNAALFRNSGNASLLAGDLPQAILAYRAGLQLSPGNRALQRSLNFA